MPALEVLAVEGHSYRAPKTDLTAFAKALRSASTGLSHRPRLTTLSLKHFKVEGVAGLAALGAALSEDRFPRLSALSLDNCRLVDDHMRTLAAALPGMSRTLKTLSLRSNYALSAEGISALADVLQAGWVSAEPRYPRSDTSREGSDQCNDQRSDRADGAKTTAGNNTAVTGVSMYSSAAEVEAEAEAASTVPTRAPAWSVPVPVVPVSSEVSTSRLPAPAVPRPLMIESLDLSYSCWWRRPRRTMDAENSCSPLTSLLRALGEGACPRLKFLSLAGCYFGDTVVEQLVAALETGCRGLRVLDVTGNLFGKVSSEGSPADRLTGRWLLCREASRKAYGVNMHPVRRRFALPSRHSKQCIIPIKTFDTKTKQIQNKTEHTNTHTHTHPHTPRARASVPRTHAHAL